MQCCLLGDFRAREEYCKTIAVALLLWQPWFDQLPGCCFVEESGKAMLSRLAGSCQRNSTVRGFDNTHRLFVSCPHRPAKNTVRVAR